MLIIIYIQLPLSLNFAPHQTLWLTKNKQDKDSDLQLAHIA